MKPKVFLTNYGAEWFVNFTIGNQTFTLEKHNVDISKQYAEWRAKMLRKAFAKLDK
jgi:hypothetical protein